MDMWEWVGAAIGPGRPAQPKRQPVVKNDVENQRLLAPLAHSRLRTTATSALLPRIVRSRVIGLARRTQNGSKGFDVADRLQMPRPAHATLVNGHAPISPAAVLGVWGDKGRNG